MRLFEYGTMNPVDDWQHFMRHIHEWGWPHAFLKLADDALVVADSEFLKRIKKLSNRYECHFATPEELNSLSLSDFKSFLILLKNGEAEVIKELSGTCPKALVVSGKHEMSLVNAERLARLKVVRTQPKNAPTEPIVFLSTPNSGAEFFAACLEKNGHLRPWEYIGRPFASMVKLYADLDFGTLISNVEERYKTDMGIAYHFQTDVLDALFKSGTLAKQEFSDWVHQVNAKVVTFRRPDHFQQAFITGMLKGTYNRSVWTMRAQPAFKFNYGRADCQNVMEALLHLNEGEQLLDELCSDLGACYHIDTLSAQENPEETLLSILDYLGMSVQDSLEMLDYSSSIWHKANMQQGLVQVRGSLIDRLGLHVKDLVD